MVAGKGIEATDALGYHPGGAESTNGDVGITRVVGKSTAPVYDDRMDDWGERYQC